MQSCILHMAPNKNAKLSGASRCTAGCLAQAVQGSRGLSGQRCRLVSLQWIDTIFLHRPQHHIQLVCQLVCSPERSLRDAVATVLGFNERPVKLPPQLRELVQLGPDSVLVAGGPIKRPFTERTQLASAAIILSDLHSTEGPGGAPCPKGG